MRNGRSLGFKRERVRSRNSHATPQDKIHFKNFFFFCRRIGAPSDDKRPKLGQRLCHRATEKIGEKGNPIDLSGFPAVSAVAAVATMRYTKYSKWTGRSWDDISLEELMEALTDHLLRSGFEDQFRRQYRRWSEDWGYD